MFVLHFPVHNHREGINKGVGVSATAEAYYLGESWQQSEAGCLQV